MKQGISTLAIAVALGMSNLALAQEDSPPTVPTNLSAARYNGAGVELFWNRSTDDRGITGYEVTVNGQSVGVLDATSYYDASLQAGSPYAFTVTAIDSAGQRSATARTALDGSGAPTSGTTAPAAPANLTAAVYSATAAEFFWNRSAVPGLRYAVIIDGTTVGTTDGTSFFTDTLVANSSYSVEVVAIDDADARSLPSSLTITTGTGGGFVTPTPGTPDTFAELAPTNLTIQVYSNTAAELFWTPSQEFSFLILRNEIRRNGTLIATLQGTGLRSFFDDTREPGTSYTYEVSAIADQGSASAQVSDAGTTPPTTTPTPTAPASDIPADVQADLSTAFNLINGDAVARVVLIIDQLSNPDVRTELGFSGTGETALNTNQVEAAVLDCPNGGQLLDTANPEAGSSGELEAVDCAVGSVVFSFFTQFNVSNERVDGFNLASINAINIELDDQRDLSTTTIDQAFSFTDGPGVSWIGSEVSVESAGESYTAAGVFGADQDVNNRLPDGSLGLTATAQQVAGVFGNVASLRTLGPLEFTEESQDGQPVRGRIVLEGGNDSLLIDASNGDPSSFSLTVTTDGATTSYTVPFTEEYRFRAPFTSGVDAGL